MLTLLVVIALLLLTRTMLGQERRVAEETKYSTMSIIRSWQQTNILQESRTSTVLAQWKIPLQNTNGENLRIIKWD